MKKILLALSALAISTAAASAADLAHKTYTKAPPPPPPPPCIWCGFYIGLNGGWAGTTGSNNSALALTHFESDPFDSSSHPIFVGPNTFNQNTSGGFGGGQIGYNWVFPGGYGGGPTGPGGWLVGVEADIQGASLHRSFPTLFFADGADIASVSTDSRLNWFGTLRGRFGFATGPVLFYGTGGFAFGGVRNNLLVGFTDTDDCTPSATQACSAVGFNGNFNNNNNNTRTGWVLGAGLEWMFAPNWSLKGEYQYINLGSVTQAATAAISNLEHTAAGVPFTEIEGVTAARRVNMNFNTVRVGVNYHFGGPGLGGY
jgi:outer membrane immunogenic protein